MQDMHPFRKAVGVSVSLKMNLIKFFAGMSFCGSVFVIANATFESNPVAFLLISLMLTKYLLNL